MKRINFYWLMSILFMGAVMACQNDCDSCVHITDNRNGTIKIQAIGGKPPYKVGIRELGITTPHKGPWTEFTGEVTLNTLLGKSNEIILIDNSPRDCQVKNIFDQSRIQHGSDFTDDRDNEVYKTIMIDSVIWMAENLRYSVTNSHELIPKRLGRLYTWDILMNGASSSDNIPSGVQGLCPNGWHLPSDKEWISLEISLGLNRDAYMNGTRGGHGLNMKSTEGWTDSSNGRTGNGNNSSGFNIYPTGFSNGTKGVLFKDHNSFFWTTTENSFTHAYARGFDIRDGVSRSYNYGKTIGMSCRCVKDK